MKKKAAIDVEKLRYFADFMLRLPEAEVMYPC